MADDVITLRRARAADVPRMIELIAGAELPPLFVSEYVDSFVVAERANAVLACGAVEVFGQCGVIRSVVVDPSLRGSGVGKRLWQRLEADARAAGVTDLYLFTADAHDFWRRLGFSDIGFEDWRPEPRMNWQYQFLSQNRDLFEGQPLFTMWRAA